MISTDVTKKDSEIIIVGCFFKREILSVTIISSLQIALGLLSMVIGGIAAIIIERVSEINTVIPLTYGEIVCGFLHVLTGSFGISASKKNWKGLTITHLTLNVLLISIVIWVELAFSGINAGLASACELPICITVWALNIVIVISALARIGITIAAIVFDSKPLCPCCRASDYFSKYQELLIASKQAEAQQRSEPAASVTNERIIEGDSPATYEVILERDIYDAEALAGTGGQYVVDPSYGGEGTSESYSYCSVLPRRPASLPGPESPLSQTSTVYIDVIA